MLSATSGVDSPGFITGCVRRSTSASLPVVDHCDLANAVYENGCDEYDVWRVREREREREGGLESTMSLRASLLIR